MLIRIDESRGLERIGPVRQVRFEVLRKPLGMGFDATLFAGDEDLQTRHVVAFRDTEPIGCLTLMPPELRSGIADRVQLRGMAVLQAWQGRGIGRQLLDYVAQLAESQGWELWCNARLSAVPLQVGLVLKPGSQEPWTPYRMISAFIAAGIPAEAFCLYPGGHDVGSTIMSKCERSMIFGSAQTVQQYSGNPRVQAHGPGFSKILIGDDVVDRWEDYLDMMVESVASNSGRGCINCSGIWASRHTKKIAEAIAAKIGPMEALPPQDPNAQLAAFTNKQMATGTWSMIQQDLAESGVTDMTASYGPRLVEQERCAYLRPMVLHADSPSRGVASKEYMFPFVSVVECPQKDMIKSIGQTLIGTALTADPSWIDDLTNAVNIDRLNIGAVATNRLNWLQPHEGNLTEFLFRNRAYQFAS